MDVESSIHLYGDSGDFLESLFKVKDTPEIFESTSRSVLPYIGRQIFSLNTKSDVENILKKFEKSKFCWMVICLSIVAFYLKKGDSTYIKWFDEDAETLIQAVEFVSKHVLSKNNETQKDSIAEEENGV
jgi:hypothetical protein